MRDVRVTECPGREGATPLYLVSYRRDFRTFYKVNNPEQEFLVNGFSKDELYPLSDKERERAALLLSEKGEEQWEVAPLHAPILSPQLADRTFIYIDGDGKVQWPHGGANSGGEGSTIADLNGDGVLERVEQVNYRLREESPLLRVLKVETIELESQILLAVAFNWHSEDADAANRWGYEIRDKPGEPFPIIAFGPQSEGSAGGPIDRVVVEYRWDARERRYIGPEGKYGDHFRRLEVAKTDELRQKIKELEGEGSLGYPLLEGVPPARAALKLEESEEEIAASGAWKEWPKYEHRSLAALDDEELFRWQYGGELAGPPFVRDRPIFVLPPRVRQLPPADAALALAEANRTRAHRRQYELFLVDAEKPIPSEAVLELKCDASGYATMGEWVRLQGEGAEWWSYSLTSTARGSTPLWRHYRDTEDQLRWLVEVIAWLERVRTMPRVALVEEYPTTVLSSHAEMWALTLQPEKREAPLLKYPMRVPELSGRRWKGRYNRRVAQTLAVCLWKRTFEEWEEKGLLKQVSMEEAAKALLPEKFEAIPASDKLYLKILLLAIGQAGLDHYRSDIIALSRTDEALKEAAVGALEALDSRDDEAVLQQWATSTDTAKNLWARLRQVEIASAAASQTGKQPSHPAPCAMEAEAPKEWEELASAYRAALQMQGGSTEPLKRLLNASGERARELWALLREKFDGAQGGFVEEIGAAYSLSLRDVALDDLARLATTSPDEVEGGRYFSWGGAHAGKPVEGRSHLARRIVAVWQERDALTRAKLLLLLHLRQIDWYRVSSSLSREKLQKELFEVAAMLDADDHARLIAFTEWCATDAVGLVDDYPFTRSQEQWLADVLEKLRAQ